MEDFERQKSELQALEFFPAQEGISLGNRPRAVAKCRRCRSLVEVPVVYSEGAGEDAKAHHSWHLEGAH